MAPMVLARGCTCLPNPTLCTQAYTQPCGADRGARAAGRPGRCCCAGPQSGERVVVTVDGRPVAQLGPLEPAGAPSCRAGGSRAGRAAAATGPTGGTRTAGHCCRRAPRTCPRRGPRRVIYVDTSALVRRYLHDRHRKLVLEAMADDETWCASALVRTESQLALHRAAVSARQQSELWRALRDEWEAFWVVPMDDRCMARAVEVGATYGVRIVDAIHLAAADRLAPPRPLPDLRAPADPGGRGTGLRGRQPCRLARPGIRSRPWPTRSSGRQRGWRSIRSS